jgi:putative transposase
MGMRPHLRRLENVWIADPCYFVTTCQQGRTERLANPTAHAVLRDAWIKLAGPCGWSVGPYVIMPDHVHFFVAPSADATIDLSALIGRWKRATALRLNREEEVRAQCWQAGFFDHLLRSPSARSEKWEYMRQNPVRAGLVEDPALWPYAGYVHFR